jgi:hypothetical protein
MGDEHYISKHDHPSQHVAGKRTLNKKNKLPLTATKQNTYSCAPSTLMQPFIYIVSKVTFPTPILANSHYKQVCSTGHAV